MLSGHPSSSCGPFFAGARDAGNVAWNDPYKLSLLKASKVVQQPLLVVFKGVRVWLSPQILPTSAWAYGEDQKKLSETLLPNSMRNADAGCICRPDVAKHCTANIMCHMGVGQSKGPLHRMTIGGTTKKMISFPT